MTPLSLVPFVVAAFAAADQAALDAFGRDFHPAPVHEVAPAAVRPHLRSTSDCSDHCPGDLTGSGDVGLADLSAMLISYGLCAGDPGYDKCADLGGTGCVGLDDLAALLNDFGQECPPPPRPNCHCYFSSDCPQGHTCYWGPGGPFIEDHCTWRTPKPNGVVGAGCNQPYTQGAGGPCDGLCVGSLGGSPLGWEDPTLVEAAITLWTQAALRPALAGGGHMDDESVAEVLSLPFSWPGAVQTLGRHVGNLMAIVAGHDFFHHPHEEHEWEEHSVADLSDDECTVLAIKLAAIALNLEIREPGSARDMIDLIPGFCPDWETMFDELECAEPNPLDCVYARIQDTAVHIATPGLDGPF